MKIKETIERECCTGIDLKPFGVQPNPSPDFMFCKYCGKTFQLSEGGDMKLYKPLGFPWELSHQISELNHQIAELVKFRLLAEEKAKKPRKSLKDGFSTGVI